MVRYLKDPNILFGSSLSILGLYILTESVRWTVYNSEGPGPGFFPLIYGVIMLVAALVLTASSIRSIRPEPNPTSAAPASPAEAPDRSGATAAVATWIALAVSLPLMQLFGFLIGFGLVLFFIIKVVFKRPLLNAAITAAAIVVLLHLAFTELLQSPLPVGSVWSF